MISATIYNSLVSTLQNNPTLKGYIKYVFKGLRYDLEPEALPCLMVEPTQNNEIEKDMNQFKNVWLDVDIVAFSYNVADVNKAIVGDEMYRGILDIENDIRACLTSSNTLGDKVIDIQLNPTVFGYKEYPIRGLTIPARILYRQNNSI